MLLPRHGNPYSFENKLIPEPIEKLNLTPQVYFNNSINQEVNTRLHIVIMTCSFIK